jgi:hypothetical protein
MLGFSFFGRPAISYAPAISYITVSETPFQRGFKYPIKTVDVPSSNVRDTFFGVFGIRRFLPVLIPSVPSRSNRKCLIESHRSFDYRMVAADRFTSSL